ncbi:MAG: hypothetical protein SFW67_19065 [Myxococcaceae bacterium]|nr:hypothetical protein [Myxococcaceae bacterium]
MNFTRLDDQPWVFQATAEAGWLPGQSLTLFIEVDGSVGPSPVQVELAEALVHHGGALAKELEQALFDYLRWIRMKECPVEPAGVWAHLEAPQAWFDWASEETPPRLRLCWSLRPMNGDLVAVEVTPWQALGVGEFGASSLEALSFIRAQLEPSVPSDSAQGPLGRKTCHACRAVSFDVTPTCPSCGAPRWWADSP